MLPIEASSERHQRTVYRCATSPRALIVAVLLVLSLLLTGCVHHVEKAFAPDPKDAYADMFNALGTVERLPVRGRLVEEDDPVDMLDSEPFSEISQDEYDDAEVALTLIDGTGARHDLGAVKANEEGYFDESVDIASLGLPPGRYKLEVQYADRVAGSFEVELLPMNFTGVVVRSDVDLTYLDTDFQSTSGILELLFQDAEERAVLPAMETVYQALLEADNDIAAITFLSGSPRFFKRVLEGRMQLDGIQNSGLVLKPFKDIVMGNLQELAVDEVKPELEEQIGYKMYWLLRLRQDVPASTRVILMGDDSEADYVIYALYHRFINGELDADALLEELGNHGVAGAWLDLISEVAPQVPTGAGPAIVAIYINKTPQPGNHFSIDNWTVPELTRHHAGAWPLILDLYEEGRVQRASVTAVRTVLLDGGATASGLGNNAQDAVDAGWLDAGTPAEFDSAP